MRFFITSIIIVLMGFDASYARPQRSLASDLRYQMDIATVKTPVDNEVCFSPDEPCDLKFIKFIDSAEKSIDVAIYDINLDQLVHTLLVKSKKIPVRIVVDKKQAKGQHSLVTTLMKAGVNVRYGHQRGIMHNKFTIVDGKIIETGSFNYTNHASIANQENQIYLANPVIVRKYNYRFEKIWDGADPSSEILRVPSGK